MGDIREKFTANAEQFDSLLVELLEENERLKREIDQLKKRCLTAESGASNAIARLNKAMSEVMELRAMVNELRDEFNSPSSDYYSMVAVLAKTQAQSLEDYCTSIIEDEHTNKWKRAVIESLIVDCIYRKDHDTNPKAALNELLCYERKMVLDPQISEDAYDYGMRVAEAVRDGIYAAYKKREDGESTAWNIRNIDLAPIVKEIK